jgi:protocatechuate 3,4-dioxygenase alpha subunit
MNVAAHTPSQTVGPFFHDALLRADCVRNVVAEAGVEGQRIRIEGRICDGEGLAVPDAVIEIWQANHHGRYNHPADGRDLPLDPRFLGFGRAGADAEGRFWFETIKPGRVPFDAERMQTPHVCLAIFARGLLNHLTTRLYFGDEPDNGADPVLQQVPRERQATLVARRSETGDMPVYTLDIVLQGERETVFFNL